MVAYEELVGAIQDGLMAVCCRRRTRHLVVVVGDLRCRTMPLPPLRRRHLEPRSVAPSSNLCLFEFDQLRDKSIITALVDGLLHHVHMVLTEGESVRLADATTGEGVVPQAV